MHEIEKERFAVLILKEFPGIYSRDNLTEDGFIPPFEPGSLEVFIENNERRHLQTSQDTLSVSQKIGNVTMTSMAALGTVAAAHIMHVTVIMSHALQTFRIR